MSKPNHVHCYDEFPGDVKWCWESYSAPVLEPGETVEVKGELFHALPTFVGDCLGVKKDHWGAQIATKVSLEPGGADLDVDIDLTVGASA